MLCQKRWRSEGESEAGGRVAEQQKGESRRQRGRARATRQGSGGDGQEPGKNEAGTQKGHAAGEKRGATPGAKATGAIRGNKWRNSGLSYLPVMCGTRSVCYLNLVSLGKECYYMWSVSRGERGSKWKNNGREARAAAADGSRREEGQAAKRGSPERRGTRAKAERRRGEKEGRPRQDEGSAETGERGGRRTTRKTGARGARTAPEDVSGCS